MSETAHQPVLGRGLPDRTDRRVARDGVVVRRRRSNAGPRGTALLASAERQATSPNTVLSASEHVEPERITPYPVWFVAKFTDGTSSIYPVDRFTLRQLGERAAYAVLRNGQHASRSYA